MKTVIPIGIIILLAYGCNFFDKREELANDFMKKEVDSASNHLLKFDSFVKVDGVEKQKETLTYEMIFKGFVEANKDCYWDGSIISSSAASKLAQSLYGSNWGIGKMGLLPINVSSLPLEFNKKDIGLKQNYFCKKGYGHFFKGIIVFEKRDSGWKIISLDISYDEEANASNQEMTKSNNLSKNTQESESNNSIDKVPKKQHSGNFFRDTLDGHGNGNAIIYPENDSTILFYLDVSQGAPSFNMGSVYGRVKIHNSKGVFYSKTDYDERGCKLSFNFIKNNLLIKTIEPFNECGFGNGVEADGTFNKTSSITPSYFEDMEGTKVYFKNTKPEHYNK